MWATEFVPLDELKPHPRNYQQHPEDEIVHLMESVREHGIYKNAVTARDLTLLAGHGLAIALRRLRDEGYAVPGVPIHRLPLDADDPRAVKVMLADNMIVHLAERDDRLLADLLREVRDSDPMALLGTGFDDQMLANLLFVTRPRSEIRDLDEAAEWVGLPSYDNVNDYIRLVVSFDDEDAVRDFYKRLGVEVPPDIGDKNRAWAKSMRWPPKEQDDLRNVRFVSEEDVEQVAG